jgi:hypothetical protein
MIDKCYAILVSRRASENCNNPVSLNEALMTCKPKGIPLECLNSGNEMAGIPTKFAYTV